VASKYLASCASSEGPRRGDPSSSSCWSPAVDESAPARGGEGPDSSPSSAAGGRREASERAHATITRAPRRLSRGDS